MPTKRGGKRPGAGRPPLGPLPKVRLTVAINADTAAWLKETTARRAAHSHFTTGQLLDEILANHTIRHTY